MIEFFSPNYALWEKIDAFVKQSILPNAAHFDEQQYIPRSFFNLLANEGCFGAAIPPEWGGEDLDAASLGLLHEMLGRGMASIQNIVTVSGMVSKPLLKFGRSDQKKYWLPKIACGEVLAALALTEPNVGSDLHQVETCVKQKDGMYILNGRKKYITLGQVADLFLVLAKENTHFVTLLVKRQTPGLSIIPMRNFLGLRANMLAEIIFENCEIPIEDRLGTPSISFSPVVVSALDEGRYTTAHGCVGLAHASYESGRAYADKRIQSKVLIREHQLIQQILSSSLAQVKAARALCFNAGRLRDMGMPEYISETLIAKYFAAKTAVTVVNDILSIFGAAGFSKQYPAERFYRDAKIMEVIEGTAQICEIGIEHMTRSYVRDEKEELTLSV